MKLNQCLSLQISRKEHCNTYCACNSNCTLYIWHISFCQWYVMDIWYWRLKSVQRKRINCGVCSVVINVICVKGFDLFNIDAISRNPPSTPNLNKCFTKLIDDDGWWLLVIDTIYLDLCTHPFYVNVSDVRVRVGQGSGWSSDNNFRNRIQESSSRSYTVRGPSQ